MFLYLLIMIWMLAPTGVAAQHVQIQMNLPPPGTLNPEDIMEIISFNNTSPNTLHVTMMVTIEEGDQGLVFSGMSSIFSLPPGTSVPDYTVFEPVEVEYADPVLEDFVVQTNSMPGGDYVVCITLIDAEMGDEVGYNCVPHSVFHPSAPMLVYPADGSSVQEPNPSFVWLPPTPMPPIEVMYTIRMVEIFAGQLPYEAIQSNPSFFEDFEVMANTYPYPADAAPMEEGQQYAWQVQALMPEGFPVGENEGYSEISAFTYQTVTISFDGIVQLDAVLDYYIDCEINGYPFIITQSLCDQFRSYFETEDVIYSQVTYQDVFYDYNEIEFDEIPVFVEDVAELSVSLKPLTGFVAHGVIFDIYDVATGIIVASVADTSETNTFEFSLIVDSLPDFFGIRARVLYGNNRMFKTINHSFLLDGGQAATLSFIDAETMPEHFLPDVISDPDSPLHEIYNQIFETEEMIVGLINAHKELERQKKENETAASEEEKKAAESRKIAEELEKIDLVLDNIENDFRQRLRAKIDSLVKGDIVVDLAGLQAELQIREAAFRECRNQLQRLQQEEKEIDKKIMDIHNQRLKAYREIKDQLRISGFDFISAMSFNKHGDLEIAYGIILKNGDEGTLYKQHLPASIAGHVLDLEDRIKDLNKQHRDLRKRKEELPGIIADKMDECKDLKDMVNHAQQAVNDAQQKIAGKNALELRRDRLCKDIKKMFNQLRNWCRTNPGPCQAHNLKNLLDRFFEPPCHNCPTDLAQENQFWNAINQIIHAKKGIENDQLEKERQHLQNADNFKNRAAQNQHDLDHLKAELKKQAQKREEQKVEEEKRLKELFADGPALSHKQELKERQILGGLRYYLLTQKKGLVVEGINGNCRSICQLALLDYLTKIYITESLQHIAWAVSTGTWLAKNKVKFGIKVFKKLLENPAVTRISFTHKYKFDGEKYSVSSYDCQINFSLAYNPATGYVMGWLHCKCCDREHLMFIKYKADRDGNVDGRPVIEWF